MSITLTANYKEILTERVVDMIDNLLDDCHDLQAMLTFIDEHNEDDFYHFYEEYVRCGEAIGYEAVDALIEEQGCCSVVDSCDERYQGCYQSTSDFAEEFYTNTMCLDIPSAIVVDWEATWDSSLYYDFTACNDGGTYCPVHIFADN